MSRIVRPLREQVRLFVSYAHADPTLYRESLKAFMRWPDLDAVVVWTDKDIMAGSDADKRIREELKVMDIFIALVSPYFAASHYCQNVEVVEAKRRCEKGDLHVIPIVITHPGQNQCLWLMSRQHLPEYNKTWADIRIRCGAHTGECDLAITPIRDGIRKVIDEVLAKRKKK